MIRIETLLIKIHLEIELLLHASILMYVYIYIQLFCSIIHRRKAFLDVELAASGFTKEIKAEFEKVF